MIDSKMILQFAENIKEDMIRDRRILHKNPEVGQSLPQTTAYVMGRLSAMDYEPVEICESGIVATIEGKTPGRCILLRADMDALPMQEKTNLSFQSNQGSMHACGHDMHTSMLLGAARLFKEFQQELKGTIKLVFQPNEEGLTGAKEMIHAGVLQSPKVDGAMSIHVHAGTPSGHVVCGRGTFMAGCTRFRIHISGKACHGSMPETGRDPIYVAAHIELALQEIVTKELAAQNPVVISVGKLSGGSSPNQIPDEAILEGTIRSFDESISAFVLKRITEISHCMAEGFRVKASVKTLSFAPPMVNDTTVTEKMSRTVSQLLGQNKITLLDQGGMGSDDFSFYSRYVPCTYFLLGAGVQEENPQFGGVMHSETVIFNEDILPLGAALYTFCSLMWLIQ